MWNYRRYGTPPDPVHKSHLNEFTGEYGCPKRFRYAMDEAATNAQQDQTTLRSGAAIARTIGGTAVHETITRALNNQTVCAQLLAGARVREERVRNTFEQELHAAAEGRDIEWGKDDPQELIDDYVTMSCAVLESLHTYIAEVLMVEPGFTAELEGVHYAGHIDLIFRPKQAPHSIALADWKTGKTKPDVIELNHGWEAGIYSAALRHGTFLPREKVLIEPLDNGGWVGRCAGLEVKRATRWQTERDTLEEALKLIAAGGYIEGTRRFDEFPSHVYHVHLRDYLPYQKAGKKQVSRPEDLAFYRRTQPGEQKYVAGELRGPAWCPVPLAEHDLRRLAHRQRTVIGTVRMGRFLDLVREHCRRCAYAKPCLTEGYSPRGEELDELQGYLKAAGL